MFVCMCSVLLRISRKRFYDGKNLMEDVYEVLVGLEPCQTRKRGWKEGSASMMDIIHFEIDNTIYNAS